jgi:hypothetical protein
MGEARGGGSHTRRDTERGQCVAREAWVRMSEGCDRTAGETSRARARGRGKKRGRIKRTGLDGAERPPVDAMAAY